jgi:hypothetical protein
MVCRDLAKVSFIVEKKESNIPVSLKKLLAGKSLYLVFLFLGTTKYILLQRDIYTGFFLIL